MIQDISNQAPIGAQHSDTNPASTAGNWVAGSARSAASVICKLSIPNPAHYLFSAPGKTFTLLALFARGVAGATVPNTYNDSWRQPQSIALPDMPQPPEPAWMTALDQSQDEVSREKRSPRGRGGSARGGGRSSSSRGGGRSRSGGSRSRSGGSRRGSSGGMRNGWRNGRLIIAGQVARETGRTVKSGNALYKEYTISKQTYFVGKAHYELNGQRVNLHKLLMVTESGQPKKQITTSRGKQYKIISSGNWQKIRAGTGNNRFTISTLPKVREHTIRNTLFRMAMFNIFFNHHMLNPVHVNFLFHKGQPHTFSCVPSPDGKNIDIGYYDDGSVQPTTASASTATVVSAAKGGTSALGTVGVSTSAVSTASSSSSVVSTASSSTSAVSTAINSTTTPAGNSTQAPDRKFIKLASAPTGSSIKFAVLDNQNPKAKTTPAPTSVGPTNSTTPAQVVNATAPAMVGSPPADASVLVPQNTTDIESSNNITRIDALLSRAGVADNVMSQLAIMNGDEVLNIISLDRKVKQLVFDSDNDTILNYPMIGPKTIEERHTWFWRDLSNTGVKNTGSLMLPVVTALSALKRYIL